MLTSSAVVAAVFFELVELAFLIAVNFGAFAVFGQNFLIGVDDEHAVYAIHNHPFIVLNDLACIVQRNHGIRIATPRWRCGWWGRPHR